jgi:integrase
MILTDNPAKVVKRLLENERNFHVVTPQEERLYLFACPLLLRDVVGLMLQTGMRGGEVYQLKRQPVFLEKDYLKVTKVKPSHLFDRSLCRKPQKKFFRPDWRGLTVIIFFRKMIWTE